MDECSNRRPLLGPTRLAKLIFSSTTTSTPLSPTSARLLSSNPVEPTTTRTMRLMLPLSLAVSLILFGLATVALLLAVGRGGCSNLLRTVVLLTPFVVYCAVQTTTTSRRRHRSRGLFLGVWVALVWALLALLLAAPPLWLLGLTRYWPLALYIPIVVRHLNLKLAKLGWLGALDEQQGHRPSKLAVVEEVEEEEEEDDEEDLVFVVVDDLSEGSSKDHAASSPTVIKKQKKQQKRRTAPPPAASMMVAVKGDEEEAALPAVGVVMCEEEVSPAARTLLRGVRRALSTVEIFGYGAPQHVAALSLRGLLGVRLHEPFLEAVDAHLLAGSSPLVAADVEALARRYSVGSTLAIRSTDETVLLNCFSGTPVTAEFFVSETLEAASSTLPVDQIRRGVAFLRDRVALEPHERVFVHSRDGTLAEVVAVAYVLITSQSCDSLQEAADLLERRLGRRLLPRTRTDSSLRRFAEYLRDRESEGWTMVEDHAPNST